MKERKFSWEQYQKWGKLGGRTRIHLNNSAKQKAWRKKLIEQRLAELRKAELTKPITERVSWILNPRTNRIIKLKKK